MHRNLLLFQRQSPSLSRTTTSSMISQSCKRTLTSGFLRKSNLLISLTTSSPSSCCCGLSSNHNKTIIRTSTITSTHRRPSSLISSSSFCPSTSYFSTISRGQDLLAESLTHGSKRKIILDSYYPNVGVDVIGMVEYSHSHSIHPSSSSGPSSSTSNTPHAKFTNPPHHQQHVYHEEREDEEEKLPSQPLLFNSSIIAFPNSCFLWSNISKPKDVTVESLSIVQLLKPSIEYLFIGCDDPLPPRALNQIKREMKEFGSGNGVGGIVVEQMDVMNAMGTFNILNGEDRRVAVAIVVDVD